MEAEANSPFSSRALPPRSFALDPHDFTFVPVSFHTHSSPAHLPTTSYTTSSIVRPGGRPRKEEEREEGHQFLREEGRTSRSSSPLPPSFHPLLDWSVLLIGAQTFLSPFLLSLQDAGLLVDSSPSPTSHLANLLPFLFRKSSLTSPFLSTFTLSVSPLPNMATSALPAVLNATEEDIQLLLSAQCHIGSKNCDKSMEPYVWKRRADGENFCCFTFVLYGFGWEC